MAENLGQTDKGHDGNTDHKPVHGPLQGSFTLHDKEAVINDQTVANENPDRLKLLKDSVK